MESAEHIYVKQRTSVVWQPTYIACDNVCSLISHFPNMRILSNTLAALLHGSIRGLAGHNNTRIPLVLNDRLAFNSTLYTDSCMIPTWLMLQALTDTYNIYFKLSQSGIR